MPPTRGRGETRRCPVPTTGTFTCDNAVKAGHLMCGYHWRQVPKHLQTPVWATWRAWNRAPTPERWAEYAAARRAALSSVSP